MKIIKLVVVSFTMLLLALFVASIPAQAQSLANGGYHDDGVSGGNHYFEIYWYSTDSNEDCSPYSGTDGYITVWLNGSNQLSGGGWVPVNDVAESYQGVSGFSHHECQINVYLTNGAGQRQVGVGWTINGNTQSGEPYITLTF